MLGLWLASELALGLGLGLVLGLTFAHGPILALVNGLLLHFPYTILLWSGKSVGDGKNLG